MSDQPRRMDNHTVNMNPKRGTNRSRGGCLNCKTRKRKCDEDRPGCKACLRRGQLCSGYDVALRWTNGIASRGRLAWATNPYTPNPNPSPIRSTTTISVTQHDDENQDEGEDEDARTALKTTRFEPSDHTSFFSPTPSSLELDVVDSISVEWPSPSTDAVGSEAASRLVDKSSTSTSSPDGQRQRTDMAESASTKQQLFHRFINSGIHRLHATKIGSWPELFLADMALESSALYDVSVAIQAFLEDGLSVSTMEFIDQGIQTFRSELSQRHNPMAPATTAAGLLICTLHLLQARPWTQYLQLMAGLYKLDEDINHLLPDPRQPDVRILHTLEVLAVMDMPTFVVGRSNPSMGVWKIMRRAQDSWEHGRCSGQEPITGIPRSLLDIFARIYDDNDGNVEEDFWYWRGEIGEFLLCHLWDAWRYAGMLTVRHRRRLFLTSTESFHTQGRDYFSQDPTPVSIRPLNDAVILYRLLSSMDSLLQSLEKPEFSNLLVSNSLLYPLVAASLRVSLLQTYPSWKGNVDRVRAHILGRDPLPVMRILFEVLDEAWNAGEAGFDLDEAARKRDVEIAIF